MSMNEKIKPLYNMFLLPNIYADSVMVPLVSTTYEAKFREEGSDTIHINEMKDLNIQVYNGGNFEPQTTEIIAQDFRLDQYKMVAFEINKVEDKQTHLKLLPAAQRSIKNQFRLITDTYLLGSQADVPAANTIGSLTSPITLATTNVYDYCVDIRKKLADTGALDSNGRGSLVISPTQEALMLKCPEFIHATASGDNVIKNGNIGSIAGLDIYTTRNLVAISSKYHLMAFTKEAVEYALQINETKVGPSPFNFSTIYAQLWVYGRRTITYIDALNNITTQTKIVKLIAS